MFDYDESVLTEELVEQETDIDTGAKLVVYNDDVNTFEWVIACFMNVLQHNSQQAEQLAYIIHYKGKATVKTGSVEELEPYKDALLLRLLSAAIEE